MNTEALPPPDDPAWAAIRLRYEQDQETVAAIAGEMGLAGVSLSRLAKKWGWTLRGKIKAAVKKKTKAKDKPESTAATIKRIKDILRQRVSQIEEQLKQINEDVTAISTEREIRSTNTLVRTIEKVLDLERKDRQRKVKQTREFKYFDDEQRRQLADKIEKLQHEWREPETVNDTADQGSGGVEQPMALLGEATKATAATGD